jgi:predicted aspartyl protease
MNRRTLLAALAVAPLLTTQTYATTFSTTLAYDDRGRPLASVLINGVGPFPLVIDTAAGGTVLSAETLARLAITSTGTARVQGASGAVDANLYSLDAVEIAGLRRENLMAVQTPPDSVSAVAHAGVLGAGIFANTRIEFDFVLNRLSIDTDAIRAPLDNAINVEFRHRIFALAPISVAGVNAVAVIDTGARVTVANDRLRDALGFRENDPRLSEAEPIGGATGHRTPTVAAEVTPILFAGHDFGGLNLNFAELSVFAALQLSTTPALILGMDILRRADVLALDYASAKLALHAQS